MRAERLEELLAKFPRHRIAVLGDFFLDKYLEVEPALAEPSLETGRVAHQVLAVDDHVLAVAAADRRYFVRQALVTLKTLACFAYFEQPDARAHFDGGAA